jgi:DinB superfamily
MTLALVRELEGLKRELALFPDDASAWTTVPGITNSAANLALHLAGNLQYYIGGVLGGTGYVRNREAEFGRRSGPRGEIIAEIDAAIRVVRDVLPSLPQDRLDAPLGEPVMGLTFRTGAFLLHLCVHAGFHLGQAGYLRRALTGNAASSGPIPLQPLAEHHHQ